MLCMSAGQVICWRYWRKKKDNSCNKSSPDRCDDTSAVIISQSELSSTMCFLPSCSGFSTWLYSLMHHAKNKTILLCLQDVVSYNRQTWSYDLTGRRVKHCLQNQNQKSKSKRAVTTANWSKSKLAQIWFKHSRTRKNDTIECSRVLIYITCILNDFNAIS